MVLVELAGKPPLFVEWIFWGLLGVVTWCFRSALHQSSSLSGNVLVSAYLYILYIGESSHSEVRDVLVTFTVYKVIQVGSRVRSEGVLWS